MKETAQRVVVRMKVVAELAGQAPSPSWLEGGRQKADEESGRLMCI